MTTNRLSYETQGGTLSPKATFEQLREYLIRAQEDAQALSRLTRDPVKAAQWRTIADKMRRCSDVVSSLANTRAKDSTGYAPKSN